MNLPPMDWIEKMIRISSVTDQSNEELIRFLHPLFEQVGLRLDEQKVVENGVTYKNLIAFSHALDSEGLLALNTHLDTVAPGEPSLWTKTKGDPFRATKVKDRIYGLGSADVKLDLLCKIIAAGNARPWKRPFAIVGTFGEERGLVGVRHLFEKKKLKARFALIGEPSELELIYAHKGHLICTLGIPLDKKATKDSVRRWKGRAAHSSTPDLGENALQKCLTEIYKRQLGIVRLTAGTNSNRIPDSCELEFSKQTNSATHKISKLMDELSEIERQLKKRRDARFYPAVSTLSINQAETVQNELRLTFDVRLLPDIDGKRLTKRLEDIISELGAHKISLTFDAPLKGNKNGRFMQQASSALKQCGVDVNKKTKASSTEAAIYQSFGAEAIVFGPGKSLGNVHRPNEYNSLQQMNVATQFYSHLLQMSGEA